MASDFLVVAGSVGAAVVAGLFVVVADGSVEPVVVDDGSSCVVDENGVADSYVAGADVRLL